MEGGAVRAQPYIYTHKYVFMHAYMHWHAYLQMTYTELGSRMAGVSISEPSPGIFFRAHSGMFLRSSIGTMWVRGKAQDTWPGGCRTLRAAHHKTGPARQEKQSMSAPRSRASSPPSPTAALRPTGKRALHIRSQHQ